MCTGLKWNAGHWSASNVTHKTFPEAALQKILAVLACIVFLASTLAGLYMPIFNGQHTHIHQACWKQHLTRPAAAIIILDYENQKAFSKSRSYLFRPPKRRSNVA